MATMQVMGATRCLGGEGGRISSRSSPASQGQRTELLCPPVATLNAFSGHSLLVVGILPARQRAKTPTMLLRFQGRQVLLDCGNRPRALQQFDITATCTGWMRPARQSPAPAISAGRMPEGSQRTSALEFFIGQPFPDCFPVGSFGQVNRERTGCCNPADDSGFVVV
jgi:hypothetical protein